MLAPVAWGLAEELGVAAAVGLLDLRDIQLQATSGRCSTNKQEDWCWGFAASLPRRTDQPTWLGKAG